MEKTNEQRKLVESMSGLGLPDEEIALLVGVEEDQLRTDFSHELAVGQAKANGQVSKAIFNSALAGDVTSQKLWVQKRGRGRPKGSFKTDLARLAEGKGAIAGKTEYQKIKELKSMLLDDAGHQIVGKAIEIAMNDEHPHQGAMIKLCVDRLLPLSLFEKEKNLRSAITINITGLSDPTLIPPEDITDV
jgi:hypothetical protein